jgi:signal peptidase I
MVTAILMLAGVYVWNPFNFPSWSPMARIFGFTLLRSTTASMEPALARDTRMLANAWPYAFSEPKMGDIAVFRFPPSPSVLYAMRIVAVGGSTVSVSENCLATVNGRLLDEPYVRSTGAESLERCQLDPVTIPAGKYFVLNDNRTSGMDSRRWGFVPRENMIARIMER